MTSVLRKASWAKEFDDPGQSPRMSHSVKEDTG